MTTKTSPMVVLLFGTALLLSASSSDAHAISTLANIPDNDAKRSLNYATFEADGWFLDGGAQVFDHPQDVGFVSDDISGAAGSFTTAPEIRLTLSSAVDVEQGITLEFNAFTGDYADDVTIEYRNASDVLIASESHTPDSVNYFCPVGATRASVKYIDIAFNGTNENERHVRLISAFVDGVMFNSENLRATDLVEEDDIVSTSAPANTFDFRVFSEDADFSIVDPSGIYANIRQNQPVQVWEFIDDVPYEWGTFYVKNNYSISENEMTFECVDALTILETEDFYGYWWKAISNWDAENAMSNIMGDVFSEGDVEDSVFEWEIDTALASKPVVGWLPISNRREALNQLAFSVGGVVTCTRDGKVKISAVDLVDSDTSTFDYTFAQSDLISPTIKKLRR